MEYAKWIEANGLTTLAKKLPALPRRKVRRAKMPRPGRDGGTYRRDATDSLVRN